MHLGGWAFRKNLPTKGTNDTQAAESTLRAIKHYAKVEFGAGGSVRGGRRGARGRESITVEKESSSVSDVLKRG